MKLRISRFLLAIALVALGSCDVGLVPALAQVQNIPDTTFPATRILLNSNFSYLAANKLQWQGAWSSLTTYNQSDVVAYNSASYISLVGGDLNHTPAAGMFWAQVSEEHTSELQSRPHLVCRLLLEK